MTFEETDSCELLKANLSRDETAQVGVHVFHEGHVEQREARLHGGQNVSVTGQRVVSPLRLSPVGKNTGKDTSNSKQRFLKLHL